MKKALLLTLSMGIGLGVSAQQKPTVSQKLLNQQIERTYELPDRDGVQGNAAVSEVMAPNLRAISEIQIGKTVYDLQSNAGITNRLYHSPDGKKAAVWIMGESVPPGFSDRGTGYNYFDGTVWQDVPDARLENVRTGWPTYAKYKNGEVVFAHSGKDLVMLKRDVQGQGNWEEGSVPTVGAAELSWPRAVSSGENNEVIHVVAHTYEVYEGQKTMLYYRSTDGGETWVDKGIFLPGMSEADGNFYVGGDSYYMAAQGNNVAVLVAENFGSDMLLIKSEDNGATWNKTVIWENPIKSPDFGSAIFDTAFTPDGTASIDIDDNGKAHVAFAITCVLKKEVGTTYGSFGYDGIVYWKEGQEPFTANDQKKALHPELIENKGYLVGFTPDLDGNGSLDIDNQNYQAYQQATGLSKFPAISCVSGSSDVFVAWCSPNELADNGTHKFHHIFSRTFSGGKWSDEINHVTKDEESLFSECIWPQIFKIYSANEKVHILYMKDDGVGIAGSEQHPYGENFVQYMEIDKSDLNLELSTTEFEVNNFSVKQNFPNPVSGITTIEFSMEESATVKVQVLNLIGQEVFAENKGRMQAGTHQTKIDATAFETGVYFYNVTVGEKTVTKKMIVK